MKCQITWTANDIQDVAPEDWTEQQCQEWLDQHSKVIVDRSVELGWDVIHDLIESGE